MRQIPPIPLKDKYWLDIQKEIERIFNEVLFIPLYRAVKLSQKELKNAPSTPLEKAIADGRIYYDGQHFKGTYSAAISKELKEMGAKFLPKSEWWVYSGTLPAGISFAIAAAAIRYEAIKKAVLYSLDDANIESIDNLGKLPDRFNKTIDWINDDWDKALKGITVSPKLTEGEQNGISLDYSHNMSLYIKKWTEESILELRQDVQNMVYAGQRPDAIAKLIQSKYGQSKRKAAFLASQETRLLMGNYHRQRAKSVGSNAYIWRGMMDAKERPDHRLLEGKRINIDSPPVVDLKTGRRAHAGEDFECRCIPIYIIE